MPDPEGPALTRGSPGAGPGELLGLPRAGSVPREGASGTVKNGSGFEEINHGFGINSGGARLGQRTNEGGGA